ncbi:MAG TPA: hypothetical protein DGG95_04760 [Cytophagales bacterium]|jgi:protein gp37|nr:hypothetical protein [Cytophagales bacterium]
MNNSKIEWTSHTANLWWGCARVHEGCDNCYAELMAKRYGHDVWGIETPRRKILSVWDDLDRYQRKAEAEKKLHRVFVGSMMDIFEKSRPLVNTNGMDIEGETDDLRKELFQRISDDRYPNLMFLLLTKRPSNINKYIPSEWKSNPPPNVMFGTSVVNQKTFSDLVPHLLKVNGYRFLSCEPQLAPIDLKINGNPLTGIDWVIQGGESGQRRRPFDLAWARSMREQCKLAGIRYFFKQIDKVQEIPKNLLIRQFPTVEIPSFQEQMI